MSGAAAITCACCDLIDWIEIVNVCDAEDKYYLTLEECAAMTPDCDTVTLTFDGDCFEAGATHYGEAVTLPHFEGEIGECPSPGCYDVILKFIVDMPWVEGECYSECDVEGGDCTGITPGEVYRRYPGEMFPGYFEEDGCDTTLPYWDGKIGIICPATLDPENCESSICTTGIDPDWFPVRMPRGCLLAGLVDIICKNAPDPPEVACCAAFDPDEFTWYDDFDGLPTNNCCYENDADAFPCICDEL